MPNNIKTMVKIIGNKKDVQKIIKNFSTHYPSVPDKAYDESFIYKNLTSKEFGWWDPEKQLFTTQNDRIGRSSIPSNFVQQMSEPWTRFPDFNKIIPRSEDLDVTEGGHGLIGLSIVTKADNKYDTYHSALKKFNDLSEKDQKECLDLGLKYKNNIKKYGHSTWYKWSIDNWGTKWNAYSCEQIDDNTFTFETAWSFPFPVVKKICKENSEVTFSFEYADEDFGSNCGRIVAKGDNVIECYRPKTGSDEAMELAAKVLDDQNWVKIDGQWEWVNDE